MRHTLLQQRGYGAQRATIWLQEGWFRSYGDEGGGRKDEDDAMMR